MSGVPAGSVVATRGSLVDVRIPTLGMGAGARIVSSSGRAIPARVVSIDGARVTLAAFTGLDGVAVGDAVVGDPSVLGLVLGTPLLGRAIDALGLPLDGGPAVCGSRAIVSSGDAPPPGERRALREIFATGVRAIDGPLAFGVGARIGLFGAPGCGKSTLLETIVAGSSADVSVIGLVGERGREAERWLTGIGPRTTVVCATSDRSPAERVRAAEVAFAQADALRRRGLDVLLVLDSLARVAAAARDVALATGEPVGRGGYPPSVFGILAGLIERAGAYATGSITLVATVLSDGPDERDPVSDACRAALDGHLILSERLAARGWFPAIDLPASASRTLAEIASPAHLRAARRLRTAVALLEETREARGFGLDPGAGDPAIRGAVALEAAIGQFLRRREPADLPTTLTELTTLTDRLSDGYHR